MEPADWIGVGLIVLGLALVTAAVLVHKRKGGGSVVNSAIHPSLAKDLSEDLPERDEDRADGQSSVEIATQQPQPAGVQVADVGVPATSEATADPRGAP